MVYRPSPKTDKQSQAKNPSVVSSSNAQVGGLKKQTDYASCSVRLEITDPCEDGARKRVEDTVGLHSIFLLIFSNTFK